MSIEEGRHIAIRFSEALTGDVSGNEACFTVTVPAYNMVPGGTIVDENRTVVSVERYASLTEQVDLSSGSFSSLEFSDGALRLVVE